MKKLRIAIIGCNNMGSKHIKVLRENFADEVEIAGILNRRTTAEKAAELGVHGFNNLDEINKDNVDAVIIATPAPAHLQTTLDLLRKGIPCLLEKPMAINDEECQKIIQAAHETQTPILVGHTENFNPAVIALKKDLSNPVTKIKALRISNNTAAEHKVTVIPELMIHDLAIVSSLLPEKPKKINVSRKPQYSWMEHAKVNLSYLGAEVEMEAAIANIPVEKFMEVTDSKGNSYRIEFNERRLSKNGQILCEGGNSLVNEQRNFINMARGLETPFVSLEEARQNLNLCSQIEAKMPAADLLYKKMAEAAKSKN